MVELETGDPPDWQFQLWNEKKWEVGGSAQDMLEAPHALCRDLRAAGIPFGPGEVAPDFHSEEDDAARAKRNDEWKEFLR